MCVGIARKKYTTLEIYPFGFAAWKPVRTCRSLIRQVSVLEHRINHIVDLAQGMRSELNSRGVTNRDIRLLERWADLISVRRSTFARAAQAAHIAGLRPLHTALSHELMRPTHDAPNTDWEPHQHRQYRFGRDSATTPCSSSPSAFDFIGEDDADMGDVEDDAPNSESAATCHSYQLDKC